LHLIKEKLGKRLDLQNECFREVWNLKVPASAKVFRWRVLLDRLPSRTNLESRGVHVSCNLCPLCNKEVETIQHLLINCEVAQRLWIKCDRWVRVMMVRNNDIVNHFCNFYLFRLTNKQNCVWKGKWVTLAKAIWTHRNRIIFEGGKLDQRYLHWHNYTLGLGQNLVGLG